VRRADLLSVDLDDAIAEKLRLNEERYPVERARGSGAKYTELGDDA
jgi:dCTP diphosphatase